jgi:hypothetical protein
VKWQGDALALRFRRYRAAVDARSGRAPSARELLFPVSMQLSHASPPKAIFRKWLPKSHKPAKAKISQGAIAEIQAYITIRDQFLSEAEKFTTDATLHRACIANDVVETCLKTARSPYEAQHLPEDDANRERKRCEAVKIRIGKLACIATARCEHAANA